MTEPNATEPALDRDAPDVAEPDDDVELPKDLEAARKLRNEAANLRRRNRELEEVNERLLTQAQATERREIERTAPRY